MERDKVRELLDADADVASAWEQPYGPKYDDDAIEKRRSQFEAKYAELKDEGYGEEYLAAWRAEEEPKLKARLEEMRRSGRGEFNLDARDERVAYLAAMVAPETPETVPPVPDDASKAEREQYMNARMAGAEVVAPAEKTDGEAN